MNIQRYVMDFFVNGLPINSNRVNTECPICLDPIKPGDQIIYACEAQHLHHTECFQEMIKKCEYSCSICRKEIEYIEVTECCSVCRCRPRSSQDNQMMNIVIGYPCVWFMANLCCLPIWCNLCYSACCKSYIVNEQDQVAGLLNTDQGTDQGTTQVVKPPEQLPEESMLPSYESIISDKFTDSSSNKLTE